MFLGREAELALLNEVWHQVKNGKKRSLLISGEPGSGKSRLLNEFIATLETPASFYSMHCIDRDEDRPFHPLIDLLQKNNEQPAATLNLQKNNIFRKLLNYPNDTSTLIPSGFCQQLAQFLCKILPKTSNNQPMIITLEDIHWIDPSSLQLLNEFLWQAPPLLLLVTARPEFPTDALKPLNKRMNLSALDEQAAGKIVQALSRNKLPASRTIQLIKRAEGIPLYIEELTYAACENQEVALSLRLSSLLMARINLLGDAKRLIQCAAILGRDFSQQHLIELYSYFSNDEPPLQRLLEERLLIQHTPHHLRFHHALYQDAAYATLITSERETLHFKAAQLLVSTAKDLILQKPGTVAWHYAQGRAPKEAAEWWLKAATQALHQGALLEAKKHTSYAQDQLQLLPHVLCPPPLQRESLVMQGTLLYLLEGYGSAAAAQCFDKAHLMVKQSTSLEKYFAVCWGEWLGSSTRGGHLSACNKAAKLVALADSSNHPGLQALAWWALGDNQLWLGKQAEAANSLKKAIAYYHQPGGNCPPIDTLDDAGVMAQAFFSWNAWLRGDEHQAKIAIEKALAQADQRPGPLGYALAFAAYLARMEGDYQTAEVFAHKLLNHGHYYHLPLWEATGQAIQAWARVMGKQDAHAMEDLKTATNSVSQAMPSIAMTHHAMVIEAYGALEQTDCQIQFIQLAINQGNNYQDHFLLPEILRHQGDALLKKNQPDLAKHSYLESLELATKQAAEPFIQRASSALANLAP